MQAWLDSKERENARQAQTWLSPRKRMALWGWRHQDWEVEQREKTDFSRWTRLSRLIGPPRQALTA